MAISLKKLKTSINRSTLLRNALWFLGGNGVRVALQAVYFVVIARTLGVAQYGAFVGAVALMALVAPFSTWGTGFILMKTLVRDRANFARYWGAAFCLTIVAGIALIFVVVAVSRVIWGQSLPLLIVLLVGVADVILVRIVELSAQAFTAIELLRKNSELYIVLSVARTLAAIIFAAVLRVPTATSWSWLYLLSAFIASAYSVTVVARVFGRPQLRLQFSYRECKEGFYFAVAQVSQTIYNDIDKTMLVRFSGLDATGIYGAAYRIIDVSFAPVGALIYAAFPRLLHRGEHGISATMHFAKKLIAWSAVYGFLCAGALYVCAPVLPGLLGKTFIPAVLALRWLSPLVFIKSVHYFLADSLTGAGFQGVRTSVQLLVVVINVTLNLWLIPAYSWRGAAWASLASDGLLLAFLFAAIQSVASRPVTVPAVARN